MYNLIIFKILLESLHIRVDSSKSFHYAKTESNISLNDDSNKEIREIRYPIPLSQIKKLSNYVKTTKYTLFTFLPLNLWQQFHRLSNCYFLLGILATMTGYSSINPASQSIPLIFVLGVTAIKDAFSDYNRHVQDKKANLEYYTICRNGKIQKIYCQDINPGDILILEKDDKIPADSLLIASSNEENECYIETSDLDGETNLKHCVSLPQLSFLRGIDEFNNIECIVRCEPPNDSFSSFDGTISLHKLNSSTSSSQESSSTELIPSGDSSYNDSNNNSCTTVDVSEESSSTNSHRLHTPLKYIERYNSFKAKAFDKELPISSDQILFRGSVLRNTNCIYALSLYTGKNTRIFLNSKQTGLKFSSTEHRINMFLVIIIIFNIILLAISITIDVKFKRRLRKNRSRYGSRNYHWYLDKYENQSIFEDSIKSFFSFFGLYSYLVPISIFVTLEGVRVLQTKIMEWDHRLMGKRIVTVHPNSGSKNINNTVMNLDNDPNLPEKCDSKRSTSSTELRSIESLQGRKNNKSTRKTKKNNEKKIKAAHNDEKSNEDINNDSSKTLETQSLLSESTSLQLKEKHLTVQNNGKQRQVEQPCQGQFKTTKQIEWVPMKANSFNLGDDLGQVEYIFSDKTGTLTQNFMKLSKWCINGVVFDGSNDNECFSKIIHNKTEMANDSEMNDYIYEYCRAITTCNMVIPTQNHQNNHIDYESQSPDEVALIQGLTRCGVQLLTHTKHDISIQIFDAYEEFTIEMLTEFSSDRKRMSIIVKDKNNQYTLYCKGADDVIMERLSTDPNVNTKNLIASTRSSLKEFSQNGLRCLVVAMRKFDQDEIEQFLEQYRVAENSIGNRNQNVNKVVNSIEKNLKLLGVTAIEDQLQDEVPETIDYLIHCGIKFWLLTGDNQDTAINIGSSSKLISKDTNLIVINAHSASHCGRLLDKQIARMKERGEWGRLFLGKPNCNDTSLCDQENFKPKDNKCIEHLWKKNALVVSGTTLKFIFDQDVLPPSNNQVNRSKLNATLPKLDDDGNVIENGRTITKFNQSMEKISFIRWIKNLSHRKRSRTIYPDEDNQENEPNDGTKSLFSTISSRSTASSNDKKSNKESMSLLQKKFVELGVRCHSVICCRATPSQKAKVVNIIKTSLNKMTLAIGDGANDVAMIQKAHIGIGIIGREGTQAMRASDYAILEFKFLKTLLCIHGRYSFLRVSKMVYHSFYKNFVLSLIQFLYMTVSYWSGSVSILTNM
ncbi:phospholipid-translocating P-type ATPase [Piromyces finnis]|uniref:Phospholipid-translocating P-type ATPase n=1 Tax=Piromyces finnis TaxID=1754191 RepID=A0A1Y1V6J7_9FUNG|nr:phospholipid-translocating P-type ATPase [Piromyces finnis]|eukprot:ORX47825.1 phospholipid-translocating P-type ATPase [Piromyces finnis]